MEEALKILRDRIRRGNLEGCDKSRRENSPERPRKERLRKFREFMREQQRHPTNREIDESNEDIKCSTRLYV